MSEELAPKIPASYDSEIQLLAQVIFSPVVLPEVQPIIRDPAYFYYQANRRIWEAVLGLTIAREEVNLTTVANWLESRGLLESAVSRSTLRDLMSDAMVPTDPVALARHVADLYHRRQLGAAAMALTKLMGELSTPLSDVRRRAEEAVFQVTQSEQTTGLRSIGDALVDSWSAYERRIAGEGQIQIATGLYDLDQMLGGGIRLGTVTTIMGRPAVGKSAALMTLACNIAANHSVAVFSLEMTVEQLTERLLVAGGINADKWRKGQQFSDREHEPFVMTMSRLSDLPLYLDESTGITPIEIGMKLRRLIRDLEMRGKPPLRAVFVDFLQLMTASAGSNDMITQLSRTTKGLCAIAKELNVAVVLLSQINRSKESNGDKRPTLSDARGSGTIEEDSAVVVGLYRESYYNPHAGPEAEWIVLKNRFGPTGTIKLLYNGPTMEFRNATWDRTVA